ncbi:MAG: hypothetical protein Q4D65_02585 [Peptostreptococcaceae bacterium]|nr:hypothetical protein [Peptostreptococcaceae bacterium]
MENKLQLWFETIRKICKVEKEVVMLKNRKYKIIIAALVLIVFASGFAWGMNAAKKDNLSVQYFKDAEGDIYTYYSEKNKDSSDGELSGQQDEVQIGDIIESNGRKERVVALAVDGSGEYITEPVEE